MFNHVSQISCADTTSLYWDRVMFVSLSTALLPFTDRGEGEGGRDGRQSIWLPTSLQPFVCGVLTGCVCMCVYVCVCVRVCMWVSVEIRMGVALNMIRNNSLLGAARLCWSSHTPDQTHIYICIHTHTHTLVFSLSVKETLRYKTRHLGQYHSIYRQTTS